MLLTRIKILKQYYIKYILCMETLYGKSLNRIVWYIHKYLHFILKECVIYRKALLFLLNERKLRKYRVIQNDCRGFKNLSRTIHLVLQMQRHVISFYGVTSGVRFMFFLFPQVFRNWRLLHATNSLERTRLSCWCL